jgi:DNA polymerase elongation subunit (family B)
MERNLLNTLEDVRNFRSYVQENKLSNAKVDIEDGCCIVRFTEEEQFIIPMDNFEGELRTKIYAWIKSLKDSPKETNELNALIFGKDPITHIVSCEVNDSNTELFIEKDGQVEIKVIPNQFWMLSNQKLDYKFQPLTGNLHYKFIKYYNNKSHWYVDKNKYRNADIYCINDEKEAAMILNGFTYFKGMKVSDVSILSFDIESTGLNHDDTSKVLIISNTFRDSKGNKTRKLFCIDEFESEKEMLDAWCGWVRCINPSIICGHNIFGYDLPYINFCAEKNGTTLSLGRDNSDIKFNKYSSKFRKDGSQDYEYFRAFIYGREIVDTMFVAYHFDFARKYESYGLKQIIKQEGLEVSGRQFYDAGNIARDWHDVEKRQLIKKYAEHDADDALALYDLMIAAYFYLNPSIPKSFQSINYSATGSQINAFLVRSYLQVGHSIPRSSEAVRFPGAISDGMPGIYKNVFKVDVASLYPSIMLQYKVYDADKDPKGNFLKMVQYFTDERLSNKKKAKETGDRYYKELEQAQKIVINSAYGLLGASGLNFNSPKNAALVTEHGRDILKKAILWATGKEYIEKKIEEESEEVLNEEK